MSTQDFQPIANFIWSVADLLRGPYRPPQYERVMLPLTVLRRFDCVLANTKEQVLASHAKLLASGKLKDLDPTLNRIAKDTKGTELGFHNHSPLDFQKLKGDPDNIGRHLQDYINGFSQNIRDIFDKFEFDKEIEKMEESNRLYLVVSKFAEMDLHPDRVDNITMGLVFEDLIRRFNEAANETAGDHFTPREVIQLMVNLLMEPDDDLLTNGSPIVTICDPACGTGGMLAEAQNWIREHNENAIVKVFGQDYNPRSFAVAASDLLIKGHKDSRVELGNTLTDAPFDDIEGFDYLLANPPFGVDWKAEQKEIKKWKDFHGYDGKLPRVNDGALLFLIYMLSKRQDFRPSPDPQKNKRGTRIAIVFNGSPLFTGGAGSGESDIRRWIIENDWLETIVAMPEQMFYNTGIGTFIWVVTNRKEKKRKGKIQLIDSRDRWTPMKRSLGDKRRYLDAETINTLTREHGTFAESDTSKLFDNADFGYRRITIERPLRLRFQVTDDAKESFLNACPELFDAVEAIEEELGTEPYLDWNQTWVDVQRIVKGCETGWDSGAKGTKQKKFFRDCFTETDPDAEQVIAKRGSFSGIVGKGEFPGQKLIGNLELSELDQVFGVVNESKGKNGQAIQYEADPKLRDNENVPLDENIVAFFLREVRPYFADSWINADAKLCDEKDGGIGKVGYELNFNREFFSYQEPRSLEEIDKELATVESKILEMLQEVTQ
ncbi:type I restriction-modification system subunit M [Arenicella xantha]|uniref:site-specific DNA-methyltransferase (adenine-specific) n=1 Tax=Arenicella xantha TaxID=644221 RepID=A0A395JNL5_9GAMM|nr:class I SAM-dependent DNA methyltransferase [Arenicella xantha]RBP52903.1 type I restriction enzyme M protein [Arenicella xantha]